MTTTFSVTSLNLPADVKAPAELSIHGNITNAFNEIVVIKQQGREVFDDAFVCHERDGNWGYGIYDMPGFHFIRVGELRTKVAEGIKFTMANMDEAINPENRLGTGVGRANWLY